MADGAVANPADLTATDLARRIASGEVAAVAAVEACLARIDAADGEIRAWSHVDRDGALRAAEMLDQHRRRGLPLGPLHGVPVGVKDIIDVAGLPCEFGSPLEAGRVPKADATVVRRLRNAGAIILGKTVTAEFASLTPGPTRNPHDTSRTPGGSSSGSAAAVAAGMVPLALGTQTLGSVIRPASFCGTFGFKPSFGAIPRTGVMPDGPSLDTVGLLARSVADLALAEQLIGTDGIDAAATTRTGPLSATAASEPPLSPVFAFVKTAVWDRAEPSTKDAFAELADALGDAVTEVTLPARFDGALGHTQTIMEAEMAKGLGHYAERGGEQASQAFRDLVARGNEILARDYLRARDWQMVLRDSLDELFEDFDAIITPSAPGEAPGPETTGDGAFCALWSLTGLPAVNLPLMTGPNGLPVGVQLVGRHGDDARLLRTARWLAAKLSGEGDPR